jgi:hypothetical protein
VTELVTVFILSKDERVRIQANPWWTYGEKKIAMDMVCSENLDSLSQLSFHLWFNVHSSATEVCCIIKNGEHNTNGPILTQRQEWRNL